MNLQPASLRVLAQPLVRRIGDYITFPVVALTEGVIHASNAEHPELVLAEHFSQNLAEWNGRPVFLNHPVDATGTPLSGSDSSVRALALGAVFNPRMKEKSLILDVWLNAKRLTAAAKELIARIEAGEEVEVSVGVGVLARALAGDWQGKAYQKVWEQISPDHLALLPEDIAGACSYEMGCGVRAASGLFPMTTQLQSLLTSLTDLITGRTAAGKRHSTSDQDLLQQIHAKTVELGADCKDKDYKTAQLFASYYAELPEEIRAAGAGGEHPFTHCMEVVIPAIREKGRTVDDPEAFCGWWKAEHAAAPSTRELRAACSCQGGNTVTKADRIAALLKRKDERFNESFKPFLEGLTDAQLEQLQGVPDVEPPAPPAIAAAAPPSTPPEPPKPLTEDEWLKQAPQNVRDLVNRQKAADTARQTELLAALKDNGVYTEGELKAMSLSDLEKTAKLASKAQPVDYGPRGAGNQQPEDPNAIPAPPSLTEKILAARKSA